MSILIDKERCVGCGKCVEACPGNLIKCKDGKAAIKCVKDCWGCTSCLKECKFGAINFFLGADVGGKGSILTYEEENQIAHWKVISPQGETLQIDINKKESNKY